MFRIAQGAGGIYELRHGGSVQQHGARFLYQARGHDDDCGSHSQMQGRP